MTGPSVEAQVEGFIARYSDEVAARMREIRARLQARLPGAVELVYDNYNALAIGYGGSEKASEIVCSIAAYPRWISLFLSHGATLDDPEGVLKGNGSRMRHLVLDQPSRLDDPAVAALLDQAVARSMPIDATRPARTVVKSISAKQRPRRPD